MFQERLSIELVEFSAKQKDYMFGTSKVHKNKNQDQGSCFDCESSHPSTLSSVIT